MTDRGAAQRRRERRLRSWLKHEWLTVAMELAAALHHSRDGGPGSHNALRGQKAASSGEKVENETHNVLRHQTTPPPGERPGILAEPGLQRSDRSLRRSAGDSLPTLALPSLAGSAGEAVDSFSLRFLTAATLAARRKEEEEEAKEQERLKELEAKKLQEEQEAARLEEDMQELCAKSQRDEPLTAAEHAALRRWAGLPPLSSSSSSGRRRKRKKRRRKRMRRACCRS